MYHRRGIASTFADRPPSPRRLPAPSKSGRLGCFVRDMRVGPGAWLSRRLANLDWPNRGCRHPPIFVTGVAISTGGIPSCHSSGAGYLAVVFLGLTSCPPRSQLVCLHRPAPTSGLPSCLFQSRPPRRPGQWANAFPAVLAQPFATPASARRRRRRKSLCRCLPRRPFPRPANSATRADAFPAFGRP